MRRDGDRSFDRIKRFNIFSGGAFAVTPKVFVKTIYIALSGIPSFLNGQDFGAFAVRPDAERTNRLTRALISRQRPSKIKNPTGLIPYRGHFRLARNYPRLQNAR
jgi:hypothetical protein